MVSVLWMSFLDQIFTFSGDQQIILPQQLEDGSHNLNTTDILAVALENTNVYQPTETLLGDVLLPNPHLPELVANQTVPTAAILSKPPIMSTLEVPTSKKSVVEPPLESGLNIEDSLAAIGVSIPSNVPSSLELPITVTNPAIASKTSPLTLNTIYTPPISSINTLGHISQISPSLGYDLFDTTSTHSSKMMLQSKESPNVTRISQFSTNIPDQILHHQREDENVVLSLVEHQNSVDNIIPGSPDTDITPSTPQIDADDGEHSNNSDYSEEIPIQPSNLVEQNHQNNNSHIQENHMNDDESNHKDDER